MADNGSNTGSSGSGGSGGSGGSEQDAAQQDLTQNAPADQESTDEQLDEGVGRYADPPPPPPPPGRY